MNLQQTFGKYRFSLSIILSLALGFVLRVYLTRYGNFGDVSVFTEWGARFWDINLKQYYFDEGWYYSYPTYPPISTWMYGVLYWLYQQRYILAQIHNAVKIIPSSFIIYFGKAAPDDPFQYGYGYFMLLKLPAILADLGISVVIYKIIEKITGNRNRAFLGMLFYLFNPVSIFLSGVWGQTESLVAFFGLLAFTFLVFGKLWLSLPFMFLSLYIKPTWMVLMPLFLFLTYKAKKDTKNVAVGIFIVFLIFLFSTYPFSGSNMFLFIKDSLLGNMLPSAKGTAMASVSAFNFYTIFYQIDKVLASRTFIGIPINILGLMMFVLINVFSFIVLSRKKESDLYQVIFAVFIISMGSYLFLTNMLERYFFASFAPMIIIAAVKPRKFLLVLVLNLILFANLTWAFYRRSVGVIGHLFADNNFILTRILSIVIVAFYIRIAFADKLQVFRKK